MQYPNCTYVQRQLPVSLLKLETWTVSEFRSTCQGNLDEALLVLRSHADMCLFAFHERILIQPHAVRLKRRVMELQGNDLAVGQGDPKLFLHACYMTQGLMVDQNSALACQGLRQQTDDETPGLRYAHDKQAMYTCHVRT